METQKVALSALAAGAIWKWADRIRFLPREQKVPPFLCRSFLPPTCLAYTLRIWTANLLISTVAFARADFGSQKAGVRTPRKVKTYAPYHPDDCRVDGFTGDRRPVGNLPVVLS